MLLLVDTVLEHSGAALGWMLYEYNNIRQLHLVSPLSN